MQIISELTMTLFANVCSNVDFFYRRLLPLYLFDLILISALCVNNPQTRFCLLFRRVYVSLLLAT